MQKRYVIQSCDLEDVKKKHQIVWNEVTTAWTHNGMLRKYRTVCGFAEDLAVVVRVYDRKAGKAIL